MYSKRERELRGIEFEIKTIGYYEAAEDIVIYPIPTGYRVLGARCKTLAEAVDAADRAHNAVKHSMLKTKVVDAGKSTINGGGKVVGLAGKIVVRTAEFGLGVVALSAKAIYEALKKEREMRKNK